MPTTTPANHTFQWLMGQLVGYSQLNEQNEALLDMSGSLADIMLGVTSIQGAESPLLATVTGALSVTVGGVGQQCILNRRIVNEVPATVLTFAANTGSTPRTDLIIGVPFENQGDPYTVAIRNPDRTVGSASAYRSIQSASFQIFQGPSPPTPSGGQVIIATVTVPPSSGALVQGDVVVNLPTFASLVNSLISAAAPVPVSITSPDASITVVAGPSNSWTVQNAGVKSIFGLIGAVGVSSADGTIGVTQVGNSVNFRNAGVTTFHGYTGAVDVESTDASVIFAAGGGSLLNVTAAQKVLSAFGTTAASYASGATSAGITLPNDGKNYNVFVDWLLPVFASQMDIASASGVSGFVEITGIPGVSGSGGISTVHSMAACTAVGGGQTLSFNLTLTHLAGYGTTQTNQGLWRITAIRTN